MPGSRGAPTGSAGGTRAPRILPTSGPAVNGRTPLRRLSRKVYFDRSPFWYGSSLAAARSGSLDRQPLADRGREGAQIVGVGADDEVVPSQRALGDASIHDVRDARLPEQQAD